ncbi:hypothetical protein CJ030_MR5G017253 [Morella rubra]|uniref:Translocase of chloroplast 159/132 membrane anchor domain-containing protein n=1 Tax=Morella rubra TaxID=262757 RepID=A0A6A1VTJ7_9ROSI|nr:hypothetical protein CJ030_MR5G017253 [Morella rubra]
MDSKVYVPLLTTQAAPQKRALSRSPSASTGSLLIRAPPTLDSDSESIGDGTFSTSSSGGGGYNGYESDEAFRTGKEFEMASERPSVADPDEETFEESFNFELSGRLVADLDRKSLKSSIGDEEESIKVVSEYGQLVEPVLVSNPSLSRVMPKAQLSMDDDCEEGEEEEEEMMRGVGVDKGFSCKVRIPGIEVLEEIGGAFRIKALGVDEDELVEGMDSLIVKQSAPAMEVKVVEMAVSDEFVEAQSGVLLMGEEEELVIEEPREDCVAAEVPEDMGLGAAEAAYIHSSTASGEHFMVRNQDVEENIKHSDEEKGVDKEGIELKGTNAGQGEIAELIETGSVATKFSTERDTVIDAEVTSEVVEETYVTVNKTDVVSSNAEDFCDTSLLKGYVGVAQLEKQGAVTEGFAETVEVNFVESSFTVREVNDSDGYVAKEAMVCQNSRSNGTDVSESFNLDKGADNDNLEGKLELGINLGGKFHDSKAFALVELLSNVPEGNDPDRIKAPATENEDSPCVVDAQDFILGSSETAKRSTREFERQNSSFLFGVEGFQGHPQIVGGQVLIESDEEVNDDSERKKLFVPAELGALLKAATGANSEEAPTGLDSSFHSLRPASRLNCPNVSSLDVGARDDFEDNLNEEEKKKTEKIQLLRVKFLRLVQRLGISLEDSRVSKSSAKDQSINWKILASIKKFLRKFPPDVVLYVDRLDTTQLGDLTDLPLLKSITSSLSTSIWLNAVVTLTHAASALPDGQFGLPLGYAKFVSQQSAAIQQSINQAIGDLSLMNQSNMPPVALVENHPLCQKDSSGERVLPNGLIWRAHLLFVFYSIKILSEATPILIPQNPVDLQKLSGFRFYFPPPTYFLASLLQPYSHPKLSGDQGGDDMDSDIELGNLSASVEEDDDEYNQLPPFIPLRKSQIAEFKKEQRKAYFEEYDYRVQLLQKKQLKGLREMKKKGKDGCNNYVSIQESEDQDDRSPMDVPDPLVNVPATSPDMALPVSFDADDPAYRYRLLEPSSHLVARPVPSTDVWDHNLGYDAVELERSLVIASRFPADFGVRIKKDKKEFSVCLDSSVAAKHGKNASTMGRFNIQTVGEQLAFIFRGETKVTNLSINQTTAGVTVTFLNGNVATGLKIEDQIAVGKLLVLAGSAGVVSSQDETASGANLELRFIDDAFPANFGMSLVKAARDMSIMSHLQSQFSIGRNTKMAIHIGVNDKRSGQIAIRTSSSEQLKIALFAILPIAYFIFRSTCHRFDVKNS